NAFYKQYDDFIVNYNEKFAKPGVAIMGELRKQELITKQDFDEEIEWTWFYLWHHEGRRARHGASMMAPDYAHWHGMYEVAERFYMEMIPQAREIAEHAAEHGKADQAQAVLDLIDELLARPEHAWFEQAKKLADSGAASIVPPPGAGGATSAEAANTASASDNAKPAAGDDAKPAGTEDKKPAGDADAKPATDDDTKPADAADSAGGTTESTSTEPESTTSTRDEKPGSAE
ncbi:MAG: hypothetical protein KDA58_14605, partial [Planctomycetaceae bacterium]|nr:hypothetical protein [Planctomycetaceae bacterium]